VISAETPASAGRYQVKLFELIEADEANYDAAFAQRFASMLAPYIKEHSNFRRRITSGPTNDGNLVQSGGRNYVHYGICQVHQCDTTTMNVLFELGSKKMVAKVLDRCEVEWLGNPDAAEKTALDSEHLQTFPGTAKRCGASK
jgi:hypothetical protein